MEYDEDKVDEVALALLWLSMHTRSGMTRAWKGLDWDILDRLHEKGFIGNPKSKAKSVVVYEEGVERAEELFQQYFATAPD